ncbi:hypothetical protein G6F40_017833 [Rhizopus arrhizus]|nr:hypothetical protein G6F40_017833 [Rhizopus arrhizus]
MHRARRQYRRTGRVEPRAKVVAGAAGSAWTASRPPLRNPPRPPRLPLLLQADDADEHAIPAAAPGPDRPQPGLGRVRQQRPARGQAAG